MSASRYQALTGSTVHKPLGLAVVAARRAFTRDLPLPPGGVLLGIRVDAGEEWQLQENTQFRCEVEERRDSRGRLILAIKTQLSARGVDSSTRERAEVEFALRWPEEPGNGS